MRSHFNEAWRSLILISLCFVVFALSGCASHGVIKNTPVKAGEDAAKYSIRSYAESWRVGDIQLELAFSGGGTRAAAFSYGVLEELKDTNVVIQGRSKRLLDEIDLISSVSGGSFTAAYYGLFGDKIFDDFEKVFLRHNVEQKLIRGMLNPLRGFVGLSRTEMAVRYYEKNIFHGATFGDMKQKGGPLILINASDLGYGFRFSFVQEYFNLLCSDLSSFPVSRAVTASSAVPVLFNPVVLENYQDCKGAKPPLLVAAEKRASSNPELLQLVEGIQSYFKKEKRFVHFVDGGITDNLGLRAIYDVVEIAGGPKGYQQVFNLEPPRQYVIITVDASTEPEPKMDASNKYPSLKETINSVTDAQLHHSNTATLGLMKRSLPRWAQEASTPERPAKTYFIQISFRDIQQPEKRVFFNKIPTSFKLSDEQVDRLIEAGRELLRNNTDFQQFLSDLSVP
jgi:NTE family protein